jgi:hypothetical protein
MRLHRQSLAQAALIAAMPAGAVAASILVGVRVLGVVPGSVLAAAVLVAMLGPAVAVGPTAIAGASRAWALVVVLVAAGTFLIGGLVWLLVAIVSLCSDTTGPTLAALCAGLAVYAPGSALAFRNARRTPWAWPLVIVLALGVSLAVLALLTGGPHACET